MKLLFLLLFIFSLCNCVSTGSNTPLGYSYLKISKEAGQMGYDDYNEEQELKKGQACSHNILGLVAFGDSSFSSAKKSGGLNKVFYSDMDIVNAIFYGRGCTVVTGI